MSDRCFYMGSWNGPGMYLFGPGGRRPTDDRTHALEYYRKGEVHLDSTLAPRERRAVYGRPGGQLLWTGSGATHEDRRRLHWDSDERPQGEFFRHELDTGFTAVSWWDRSQGDSRGAINSTILLEGVRTTEEVLDAGRVGFPRVFSCLERAGIRLVELPLP